MAVTNEVEVFGDLWCPFAHVGLRAFDAFRADLRRDDVVLRVRPWPLELVNGAPSDPIATAEHARELRAQVAPDLFTHLDITHFPTSTLEALALVEAAYRRNPATGEQASFMLRDALFEEGRDLSDPTVLDDLRTKLGVAEVTDADRAAVRASWEEGVRRGVVGSPHFFCNDSSFFCPALDIAKDDDGVHIVRNVAQLQAFMIRCLETAA